MKNPDHLYSLVYYSYLRRGPAIRRTMWTGLVVRMPHMIMDAKGLRKFYIMHEPIKYFNSVRKGRLDD